MVACASCADSDFEETTNTLKYAHRARNIKNKPVVNHDPRVAQLAALQDENEALRRELRRFAEGTVGATNGPLSDGASEIQALASKVDAAESRSEELVGRLAAAEADGDTVRRALAELYSAVCQHLPAIWQAAASAPGAPAVAAAPSARGANAGMRGGRQALSAICEELQTTRRLLGDVASAGGAETLRLRLFAGLSVEDHVDNDGCAVDSGEHVRCGEDGSAQSDAFLETGRLRSLSEMRRDSTVLIKKYLDEMARLETEIALYRRRTKQLEDELREARDDLQKDEEIFEEKMQEMEALAGHNEMLKNELWEISQVAISQADGVGDPHSVARGMDTKSVGGGDSVDQHSGWPDEEVRADLQESQVTQQRLERELHVLSQNVSVKEDLIRDLVHSEREWAVTKAQYQQRMEQLQRDLERMQTELATLQGQLIESAQLKEQTRQMESEKRSLQQRIAKQMECINQKQEEFTRLRELRHQDGCKIRELEAEIKQLKANQKEVDRRLQSERRREAQQICELQRRLQRQGQRVKDLEAENLRQRESIRRRGPSRQGSATPLGRKSTYARASFSDASCSTSEGAPLDKPTASSSSTSPAPSSAAFAASASRVQQLEQRIDEFVRRQEAGQALDEEMRKREGLLTKREQYIAYRTKIAERAANNRRSEAGARLEQVMERMAALDIELKQAPNDVGHDDAVAFALAERAALSEERAELQTVAEEQRNVEKLLGEIEERIEALQDEIDFRDARIAKAHQVYRSGTGSMAIPAAALGAELAILTAEDARELLCRCCEKLVRQRQSERQTCKRLEAIEAQSAERAKQVAELQSVLVTQDSNATKAKASLTKKYEKQIQTLLQQLNRAQQLEAIVGTEQGAASGATGSSGVSLSVSADSKPIRSDIHTEVDKLRKDNQFYKDQVRDLKRRLRDALERERAAEKPHSPEACMSSSSHPKVEELAAQVERLEREKAQLQENQERVKSQVQNAKLSYSRYHDISPAPRETLALQTAEPSKSACPLGPDHCR